MYTIPYQTIDWSAIEKTIHPGETGLSSWQTIQMGGLRLRRVEYSAGYRADHWCQKGHIVYCLAGEFLNELQNGASVILTAGMGYIVSDNASSHRSSTTVGATLFIIDGDFLQPR